MKLLRLTGAVIAGGALLLGTATAAQSAPAATTASASASASITWSSAIVLRWVDGDTVETSRGTVRLIGVDTPEVGRVGYAKATRHARHWAPVGSRVKLGNPTSVDDRDRYSRLLRYVSTSAGKDISAKQIAKGAKARYDGSDGYDRHPRQARYHRIDARNADYGTGTASSGSTAKHAPLANGGCPTTYPIKGNADSGIYHMPGQRYYDVTRAEVCFKTQAAAIKAGYRASKV